MSHGNNIFTTSKHFKKSNDMDTLKERFEARHKKQVLFEAINDADLKAVTDVITLLKRADLSAMPNIDQMIDDVVDELNNMLAKGGTQTGAVGFLKRLFTKGESALQGPVGKALALVTTLENGFKTLPAIIKANVKGNDPGIKDRPLADVAGNRRGPLDAAIKQAFTKSPLSAKGIKLNDAQLADIVDDIMAAKLEAVAAASKALASAPSSANAVANLMKSLTSSRESIDKNDTTQSEPTQQSQKTADASKASVQTSSTKPGDEGKQLSNKQIGQKLRKAINDANVDVATFNKVYNALKDSGIELKLGNKKITIAT